MADARKHVSPYQYVQNNPINAIDPTGMLDENLTSRYPSGLPSDDRNRKGGWYPSDGDEKPNYRFNDDYIGTSNVKAGNKRSPNDWYRGSNGQIKWFNTNHKSFKDQKNTTWTNIGKTFETVAPCF